MLLQQLLQQRYGALWYLNLTAAAAAVAAAVHPM
jgi:hypothetical protein